MEGAVGDDLSYNEWFPKRISERKKQQQQHLNQKHYLILVECNCHGASVHCFMNEYWV